MTITRLSIFLCATLFLIIGFSQQENRYRDRSYFLNIYKEADRLYSEGEEIINRADYTEEKEISLNRQALRLFTALQSDLEKNRIAYDSLLFFIRFKTGVLHHYFEEYKKAGAAYSECIETKDKLPALPDSLLFRPYLYLGIILYHESLFDSSLSLYKKAEQIASRYPVPLKETERLYNTLGALYNETGNFRQAKNYFEKALTVLSPSNPYYRELKVNYLINQASVLTRLEEYDAASRIYREVLPEGIHRDIILHNSGVIHLKLGALDKAMDLFRQVSYTDNRRIRLWNDMALCFLNENRFDSAQRYLDLAEAEFHINQSALVAHGQTLRLRGDLFLSMNKPRAAATAYQQAIRFFYPDFTDTSLLKNPGTFSGIFSYINLFQTLSAKADALRLMYDEHQEISQLQAALGAFHAAFRLAAYVETSYDSDEARLFLNKLKYGIHDKPISVSLQLYELTDKDQYLEDAWQFDQMNKGSILTYNIREAAALHNDEVKNESIRLIRTQLTRLAINALQTEDSNSRKSIAAEIRDKEIILGKKMEQLAEANRYKTEQPPVPSINHLRKKILDNETAILSYHLSEKEIIIINISKSESGYQRIPVSDSFQLTLKRFTEALRQISDDAKFNESRNSGQLYNWLIRPVQHLISKARRLIIIPDDELNYLPFEALQDQRNEYLGSQYIIQYHYAASLIEKKQKDKYLNEVLAFVPFAGTGDEQFSRLSFSEEEIRDLPGRVFTDQEATRQSFLKNVNTYPVLHLATHAQADDQDPLLSYIAFSKGRDSATRLLYAGEIYNLNLDRTRLVILSACETGTGQLIHGEGLMSLSRAFSYAGCPDIVTSLWKAEDQTTAFILSRFHQYLAEKVNPAEALFRARQDLMQTETVDERKKTPNYWAHLIFIGEYESDPALRLPAWYWIILIIMTAGVFLFFRNRKSRR